MVEKETAIPGKLSFAFPVYLRLRKRREFDRVRQEGRKIQGKGFILLVARNGLTHNRMGVIVSRKVRNSPDRNRLKRLCREAFRQSNPFLPSGLDLVMLPNVYRVKTLKTPLIQQELLYFLSPERGSGNRG